MNIGFHPFEITPPPPVLLLKHPLSGQDENPDEFPTIKGLKYAVAILRIRRIRACPPLLVVHPPPPSIPA